MDAARGKRVTNIKDANGNTINGIKVDKKSNETKVFNLKQEKGPNK